MTYENIKDIRAFIGRYVTDRVEAGELVNQSWATADILSRYDSVEGDDKDFYLITARQWVNDEVKAAIKKFGDGPDGDTDSESQQYVLDGFAYLQKAYPIKRGEVRCIVPVEQMSDDELMAKANEKYAMARGNQTHGDEIMHYVESRRQTA